ncbi:MAG: hypothetical protein ACM33B_02960 [Pseudomonadota bacterium]
MELLSPAGLLVAAAVVVPLAALLVLQGRSRRVRALLGLGDPGRRDWGIPAAALVAFAVLIALAAAQPAMTRTTTEPVRTDTEAFFVVDISRSMLAAAAPGAPRRIDRAKRDAVELRNAIPAVPAGIASLTDRALPHLYPSTDRDVFAQAMRLVIDVEHPPPLAPGARATAFDPLEIFAGSDLFFSPRARRRVLVVLSDAELRATDASLLAARVRDGRPLRIVFVHIWAPGERIFDGRGRPEAAYRADPASGPQLRQLARLLGATAVEEADLGDAVDAVRAAAGGGGATRRVERVETLSLAPYAVLLSLVPLALLLWRRNVA